MVILDMQIIISYNSGLKFSIRTRKTMYSTILERSTHRIALLQFDLKNHGKVWGPHTHSVPAAGGAGSAGGASAGGASAGGASAGAASAGAASAGAASAGAGSAGAGSGAGSGAGAGAGAGAGSSFLAALADFFIGAGFAGMLVRFRDPSDLVSPSAQSEDGSPQIYSLGHVALVNSSPQEFQVTSEGVNGPLNIPVTSADTVTGVSLQIRSVWVGGEGRLEK